MSSVARLVLDKSALSGLKVSAWEPKTGSFQEGIIEEYSSHHGCYIVVGEASRYAVQFREFTVEEDGEELALKVTRCTHVQLPPGYSADPEAEAAACAEEAGVPAAAASGHLAQALTPQPPGILPSPGTSRSSSADVCPGETGVSPYASTQLSKSVSDQLGELVGTRFSHTQEGFEALVPSGGVLPSRGGSTASAPALPASVAADGTPALLASSCNQPSAGVAGVGAGRLLLSSSNGGAGATGVALAAAVDTSGKDPFVSSQEGLQGSQQQQQQEEEVEDHGNEVVCGMDDEVGPSYRLGERQAVSISEATSLPWLTGGDTHSADGSYWGTAIKGGTPQGGAPAWHPGPGSGSLGAALMRRMANFEEISRLVSSETGEGSADRRPKQQRAEPQTQPQEQRGLGHAVVQINSVADAAAGLAAGGAELPATAVMEADAEMPARGLRGERSSGMSTGVAAANSAAQDAGQGPAPGRTSRRVSRGMVDQAEPPMEDAAADAPRPSNSRRVSRASAHNIGAPAGVQFAAAGDAAPPLGSGAALGAALPASAASRRSSRSIAGRAEGDHALGHDGGGLVTAGGEPHQPRAPQPPPGTLSRWTSRTLSGRLPPDQEPPPVAMPPVEELDQDVHPRAPAAGPAPGAPPSRRASRAAGSDGRGTPDSDGFGYSGFEEDAPEPVQPQQQELHRRSGYLLSPPASTGVSAAGDAWPPRRSAPAVGQAAEEPHAGDDIAAAEGSLQMREHRSSTGISIPVDPANPSQQQQQQLPSSTRRVSRAVSGLLQVAVAMATAAESFIGDRLSSSGEGCGQGSGAALQLAVNAHQGRGGAADSFATSAPDSFSCPPVFSFGGGSGSAAAPLPQPLGLSLQGGTVFGVQQPWQVAAHNTAGMPSSPERHNDDHHHQQQQQQQQPSEASGPPPVKPSSRVQVLFKANPFAEAAGGFVGGLISQATGAMGGFHAADFGDGDATSACSAQIGTRIADECSPRSGTTLVIQRSGATGQGAAAPAAEVVGMAALDAVGSRLQPEEQQQKQQQQQQGRGLFRGVSIHEITPATESEDGSCRGSVDGQQQQGYKAAPGPRASAAPVAAAPVRTQAAVQQLTEQERREARRKWQEQQVARRQRAASTAASAGTPVAAEQDDEADESSLPPPPSYAESFDAPSEAAWSEEEDEQGGDTGQPLLQVRAGAALGRGPSGLLAPAPPSPPPPPPGAEPPGLVRRAASGRLAVAAVGHPQERAAEVQQQQQQQRASMEGLTLVGLPTYGYGEWDDCAPLVAHHMNGVYSHGGSHSGPSQEARAQTGRVALHALCANWAHWYDTAAPAMVGAPLAAAMTPAGAPAARRLLLLFALFVAGHLLRPAGALLWPSVSGRYGRRAAILCTVALSAFPTAFIGSLPNYSQAGYTGLAIAAALRLVQGLSMGCELAGPAVYLAEHAPSSPCVQASLVPAAAALGTLGAGAVCLLLSWALGPGRMGAWGWRLPLVGSLAVNLVNAVLRLAVMREPEEGMSAGEAADRHGEHLGRTIKQSWRRILAAAAMSAFPAASFYLVAVLPPAYWTDLASTPPQISLTVHVANLAVLAGSVPLGGYLADTAGRAALLLSCCAAGAALAYPAWMLVGLGLPVAAWFGQLLMAVCVGLFMGGVAESEVMALPKGTRATGAGLAHALSMAVFGGTAPLAAVALVAATGNLAAPASLMIVSAVISAAACWVMRRSDIF